MLEPQQTWTDTLLALEPTPSRFVGIKQFADWVGDRTDLVQAGPAGAPLFTFNRPLFENLLMTTGFVPYNSAAWIPILTNAWEQAVKAGKIKPATTPDSVWDVSIVDVLTVSAPSATIITIPAAKAVLTAGLQTATQGFTKLKKDQVIYGRIDLFAKAFRDAALVFQFTLIGLKLAGIVPIPFPKVFPAS